ncbi:4Fe-4S dicluster domain-containing protein [Candidatus Cloacimonadota bacterium]
MSNLKINKSPLESVKEILKTLLQQDKISGVFSLRKVNEKNSVDYGLITDIEKLDNIDSFYPVMPVNAGQLLSRFTPLSKPIAAVVRPCEYRAFVEMAKREQGQIDNFLFITYSCSGVYPLKDNQQGKAAERLTDYRNATENASIPENVRPICTACEHIQPAEADIYISLVGEDQDKTNIFLNTEKAAEMLNEIAGEKSDAVFEAEIHKNLLSERKAAKEKLFKEIDSSETGLDGLVEIFGKCVGCHGCNTVCPICYCNLCDFDSHNYDYNTPILENELIQKGALRLPPDTIFFHLGRLSHMSFSCVGCGMCSDVCPASIPVASVFKKTGEETAALFDFVAGRSMKEEIPVMIFKEEEFPELGV